MVQLSITTKIFSRPKLLERTRTAIDNYRDMLLNYTILRLASLSEYLFLEQTLAAAN